MNGQTQPMPERRWIAIHPGEGIPEVGVMDKYKRVADLSAQHTQVGSEVQSFIVVPEDMLLEMMRLLETAPIGELKPADPWMDERTKVISPFIDIFKDSI